jgi:GNAT superfamily N-acetyltransferase
MAPFEKINIRKAIQEDAFGIHEAHMKSIREVCSQDHSAEEIQAWGGRAFNEAQRVAAILNQNVYVVLFGEKIEGFLHFNIHENKTEAYIFGLYLTKKACGHGLGKALMKILFEECQKNKVQKIELHSTLTAHDFYLKSGFKDSSAMTTVLINQVPVRCIPMIFP